MFYNQKSVKLPQLNTHLHPVIFTLTKNKPTVDIERPFVLTQLMADLSGFTDADLDCSDDFVPPRAFVNFGIDDELLFTDRVRPIVATPQVLFNCFGDSIHPFRLSKPYLLGKGSNIHLIGINNTIYDSVVYGFSGFYVNDLKSELLYVQPHFLFFNTTVNDSSANIKLPQQIATVPSNVDGFVLTSVHLLAYNCDSEGDVAVVENKRLTFNLMVNGKQILQTMVGRFLIQGNRNYPRRIYPVWIPGGRDIRLDIFTQQSDYSMYISLILGGFYILKQKRSLQ